MSEETTVVILEGWLRRSCGESRHINLGNNADPLAEAAEQFNDKMITVRYWITDEPVTIEEAIEETVLQMMGSTKSKFNALYSEITGYLWTDELFTVGGHNLIEEMGSFIDKYLLMEVTVHPEGSDTEPVLIEKHC